MACGCCYENVKLVEQFFYRPQIIICGKCGSAWEKFDTGFIPLFFDADCQITFFEEGGSNESFYRKEAGSW